ncbi:AAA family ATPase [Scytonema sp. NUACC21]
MLTLPGYVLTETVYEGTYSVIYRAIKQVDAISVIIKVLRAEYPTLEELTRLRHEYKTLKSLINVEGAIQTLGLENYQNGLALVLEDINGISLKNFTNQHQLSLKDFLLIAIQLASALANIHNKQVIHKDIKPHNIIINPKNLIVKIIDFSIATHLTRENQSISSPNLLEGTLAYMSPEQTGRMNRSLDYRTDFYSLGVTFYQMLTGLLPFNTTDSLKIIHAHIAKIPTAPHEVNSEIPLVISNIIMKLLAKTAEERYQNALGLKADLEACLNQLEKTDKISNFTIGQLDLYSQFLIPQKLYGREQEVSILLKAFDRISSGKTEMVLVSGYSGIGKSSLVNEIHKPIIRQRGYFISGKFEQFKRNIPYASLIQAFQELMRQLLTETVEFLESWKSKLLTALGANGQVIIDVIPEVERIIGFQPAVPQLGATESQNRFHRVFKQFLNVFTKPEHPLVLFLDDLQWADSASLKLIELIMTAPDKQFLLFIGAYRDNEVSATHPLLHTLEQIQQFGVTINNIVLQPLNIGHVQQLVRDTLCSKESKSEPLAELVFYKTQGNPFFVTQLLKFLYQEKLLIFDFSKEIWKWNSERIQEIKITDNVVELMVRQIQKLSPKTINTLKLAACIGDTFTLGVLTIVNEKSHAETAKEMWEALQAGLVLPLNNSYKIPLVFEQKEIESEGWQAESIPDFAQFPISYKFLHDRVQQASYSLIPEFQKKQIHLKIGQLLLQNTRIEERKENIFAIVNQLNYSVDLLILKSEKYEVAELNLVASQKAKAAMAYESAFRYLKVGLSLVETSSWQEQYELTLALHQEVVEVAFLNGDFEQMEQFAKVLLQYARTLVDKVKVYEVRIKACEVQRKLLEAVRIGLQVLEILDVKLVESPTTLDIEQAIEKTKTNLALKTIEDLINLPLMTDGTKLAVFRLIASLIPATFQAAPALFPLMVCEQVSLSVNSGNCLFSPSGFADYGILLSGVLQDIESGYKFGQLALNLVERLNAREVKSQTLFKVSSFTIHWKYHVKSTLSLLQNAYSSGLENGDLAHAGYSASHKCQYSYWSGLELKSLEQEMATYSKAIAQINQETALKWLQIFQQAVLNLLGSVTNPCRLIGEAYNEEQLLSLHIEANERTVIHYVFLNKLILCYLFDEVTQAVENATKAEQYLDGVTGWLAVPLFYFYDSLAQLALYPSVPKAEQEYILSRVTKNQEKMQKWANYAPMNFQHKYQLVEAEKARVLGKFVEAMELYDQAIANSKKQGYIQEEALANELAAKFYFSFGKEKIAQVYLTDAHYGYVRWGAKAKVKDIEAKYAQVFSRKQKMLALGTDNSPITAATTGDVSKNLDLATVMKATQALSGEIVLSQLLTKLMQIAIENAGAQTGFLILEKDGALVIEAQADLEKDNAIVLQSTPVETSPHLPLSLINYVARTQENLLFSNTTREELFATDPYIITHQPKSVLCTPLLHQGKLSGILYLENNLTPEAFTPERLEVLKLLSSQAAISIENARLYSDLEAANVTLEAKVQERTQELQEKNLHLQKAEAAAQSANRAKSEFLANMSHELRTPLNGILGYAQILKRDKDLTSSQKDGLNIIYQCGDHLLNLINEILDLSKIEARRMEIYPTNFHFPEFLEGIAEICRLRAQQKGISLIYQPTTQLPKVVKADEKRLRQILINLLGNAVKFTDRGTVTFKVGVISYESCDICQEPLKNTFEPMTKDKGEITTYKIHFEVEDTGVGMTTEQLKEIFLPFHQVGDNNRKVEGTGLGLSISRKLVQMMGGEIQVKSTLGTGSVFFFDLELPVNQDTDVVKGELKGETQNILHFRGNKRKIIVADDQWENRSFLVDTLAPLGFEILEAINGQDCLDKVAQFKPDCILMDLLMPTISGFEVTRQIRQSEEFKDVVIIVTSASVFDFDKQKSQEVGCNDFIAKPIRVTELLEKLQIHLELESIYEESEKFVLSQPNPSRQILIFPPPEEITILLSLVMKGDLKAIMERSTYLEELSSQYIPFSQELYRLAKGFQVKKIREFLKSVGN